MQYLRHTREHWPIWTIDAQDILWRAYLTGKGDLEGISAMPSMHVTIATLLALLGWRTNRYMGMAFTAFAATIFVGSMMLGWHYSVDGIAAAALGIAFWFIAGRITAGWAAYRARAIRTAPALGAAVLEQ
jgi:membrane-associated phospholipid phosphatase